MEESGRAFAALGAAATAEEDVWEGLGGLMDLILFYGGVVLGIVGMCCFGFLMMKLLNDDVDVVKRFLVTRRTGVAAFAERRSAARECFVLVVLWFK